MNLSKTLPLAVATFATAVLAGSASAQDTNENQAGHVEVGVLDCVVEGGRGFVFGSTKDVSCTYRSIDGTDETYFGVISKYGVDIGSTDVSYMKWGVLAPTTEDYRPGALEGDYYGISAEVTAGAGIGANALIGGFEKSFVLQPVSVAGQTGLNFALAASELELRSAAQ